MSELKLEGLELMGNNVREKLKKCGKEVRLYPLCKIAKPEMVELDNNCQIFDFVFIYGGNSVKIGKYSTITWNTIIEGVGSCEIGDRVLLGPGTKVLMSVNKHNGLRMVDHLPEGQAELMNEKIKIGNDVSLGAGCIVLPGAIIGDGVVVGANSVIRGNLEPWGIYVGSPCRKVGEREKPKFE